MEIFLKSKRFTACIPPSPCSQEMRRLLDEIAERKEVSLAEVVRVALDRLFADLQQLETNTLISSQDG